MDYLRLFCYQLEIIPTHFCNAIYKIGESFGKFYNLFFIGLLCDVWNAQDREIFFPQRQSWEDV